MNTEFFIAKRVFSQKGNRKGISNKIVSIAVASISLGLAVMIVSVAILLGFKNEIRSKVIGFGTHFQIVNFDSNLSFETNPVTIDSNLISNFLETPHVTHIQQFAIKPGIIKTEDAIHGIVLKGVDARYDLSFFNNSLIKGSLPQITDDKQTEEVLISQKIGQLLKLDTGDKLYCYFYNDGESAPRPRRFIISGIYSTSMSEFDELYIIGDLRQVQSLYGWHKSEISGYELNIDNFELLDEVYYTLRELTMNNATESSMLRVYSIKQKYSMIFDWLSVLDMNVWVLLFLMLTVAGINMISGLLIIIIERSRMIGILKALGYPNVKVRKIFIYLTTLLSARGLLWGNIAGIGICFIQYSTGIIKLDPASYYIDTVPIYFNFPYIIFLNIGTITAILLMIIIPSMLISKISPIEAISIE
ncbi:MAG: FtsX-like permease family protein [Prolixibacteraceae bacterium]|nr:FtsX-like permease family protein [Prolixibacteraceae bacterium]